MVPIITNCVKILVRRDLYLAGQGHSITQVCLLTDEARIGGGDRPSREKLVKRPGAKDCLSCPDLESLKSRPCLLYDPGAVQSLQLGLSSLHPSSLP